MKKLELYDPKENLVNISNSILAHYGAETYHPTYKPLDRVLKANKDKKVCIVLLDGFGTYIQEIYKKDVPWIYSHKKFKITSVFPPTTVAATTSLLDGKYPKETGWLGWVEKLPDDPMPITMFRNAYIATKAPIPKDMRQILPTVQLDELIQQQGYKASKVMGFALGCGLQHDKFFEETDKALEVNDFTYAYWLNPDAFLHEHGTHAEEVAEDMADTDIKLKQLTEKHKDVLFIILADHGHIDNELINVNNYPEMMSLLSNPYVSLEGRAAFFYVDKKNRKAFYKMAQANFGKDFYILTKKEMIQQKIFGLGKACPMFKGLLGDFLLIAHNDKTIYQDYMHALKSNHAGASKQERYINVAIING